MGYGRAPRMRSPRQRPAPEIRNAIFYGLRGGIAWRPLLRNCCPGALSYGDSACGMKQAGRTIKHVLPISDREWIRWDKSPTAAELDSQA